MIKINLVPQDILDKELQRQRSIQGGLILILAGVLVFGVSFMRWNTLRRADAELAAKTIEYNTKWASIGAQLDAKKAAVDALKTRLGVITDLLTGRSLYPHFMADMAHAMPSEVWVTGITTARDPSSLKVSAQALSASAPGVTRWVRTLEKPGIFGTFGDPTISAIVATDDPATNTQRYGFTMTFVYTPKP